MTPKIDWESLSTSDIGTQSYCWRAKVYGGWLIKSIDTLRAINEIDPRRGMTPETEQVSMVFIPDVMHVWDTSDKLFKEE